MSTLILNRRNASVNIPNMNQNQSQPLISPNPSPSLKPASTISINSGSLYHLCRSVLDQLSTIEGMTDYIDAASNTTDPLSKLTLICRQGRPLCTLYNALNPIKPLLVDNATNLNPINSCKATVYHFIVACRTDLCFPEEDMFSISDLYQDDTNGFVKVVNTINKILQLLEDRGIITAPSSNRNSDTTDPNAPKNTRDKVVLELLETERKYVQDMEILQNYMRELQLQKIVSPDTVHYLFSNLNSLVDFQRRFLLQLEEIVEKSPKDQSIGLLFTQMEDAFSVYEPYCANFYSAQDLVVQETPRLQKLADILDPTYQLTSFLIKPIQRICKYPLLLQELVKSTNSDWPNFHQTQLGLESIKRVTERVNETQRQHENTQVVQELKKRIECQDGIDIENYGPLLLQDRLSISTDSSELNQDRDFPVFLFQNGLMVCKESKGSHLLPKTNTLSINKKKRRGSLVAKSIFYTAYMIPQTTRLRQGVWSLCVDLKNYDIKSFFIQFKNEEQSKLWCSMLSKAIEKSVSELDEREEEENNTVFTLPSSDPEDDEESLDDEEDEYFRSQAAITSIIRGQIQDVHHHHLKAGRPYHNVPGMNLSPLPRSNSSMTTNSSLSYYSTNTSHSYGQLPLSPPPSLPSSPTATAKVTNKGDRQVDHLNSLLYTGRSQSQSAAYTPEPSLPTHQNRLRSKSNPSIMKDNRSILMTPSLSTTTPTQSTTDLIKLKLFFQDSIYAITTQTDITYSSLIEKVEAKIRPAALLGSTEFLRMKYQDEDGDLITINSDDDVQMAFESRSVNNTTCIYVSL